MAIQNQGWAYVSGSGAGVPGGSNTQVQYNDAGTLQGSSSFTFDASGIEVTGKISGSLFYGDGSNLTGITASAVNVADGPEQAIQFRVDTPVSGEISGSSALMFLTGSNTLSGTYAAFTAVTASTIVGGSPLTISSSTTQVYGPMQIQTGNSLSFNGASNTAKITNNGSNLDINSPGSIVLNSGNNSVSSSAAVTASAFIFGPSGRQQISDTGTDMSILAASTGMFISADGGNLTLQGQVAIDTAGVLSSSVNISASAFYGDLKGDSFINTSGHLTIQNTAANKKIINQLGSTDSNTSFQIRNSDGDASLAVDGTGKLIFTPTGILQISAAGVLSSSANLSASAFYANGVKLTSGIFTEIDASKIYTTSSLSVGSEGSPGATLHVSSSGDGALFRVDSLSATAPVLFASGSGYIGLGTSTPKTVLDVHYSGSTNPASSSFSRGLRPKTGGGSVVYYGNGTDLSSGSAHGLKLGLPM